MFNNYGASLTSLEGIRRPSSTALQLCGDWIANGIFFAVPELALFPAVRTMWYPSLVLDAT